MSRNFPVKTERQQVSTRALSTSAAATEMHQRQSSTIHPSETAKDSQSLRFRALLGVCSKSCLTERVSESAKLHGRFGQ